MQEGSHSRLRAGGQHQVLSRLLGRQLEEEVEGAERVQLRSHPAEVTSAGTERLKYVDKITI